MNDFKKLHSYHAAADAFGGRLKRPFEKTLRVLAPTSLPVVGGYASARRRNYRLREIFSIGAASTQVGGSFDPKKRTWTTIVSSVVENLNVNNVLFADRVAAQISIDHSPESYHPRVSFVGTQFQGLRIGSCKLEPVLNLDLCNDDTSKDFPQRSCLHNKKFVEAAHEKSKQFAEFWLQHPNSDGTTPLRGMEHLSKDGYNTEEQVAGRGYVVASVVDRIEGKCAGTQFGHAIHIPDFGRVYLGDLTVSHGLFDLTMVRLDLGSPVEGQVSAAHALVNGHHGGPGGTTSGP